MTVTQVLGAKVQPTTAKPIEWNNTRSYEPLTYVMKDGDTYITDRPVPPGVDISDTEYWQRCASFSGQIEAYRAEVKEYAKEVNTYDDKISANTKLINDETVRAKMAESNITNSVIAATNYVNLRTIGCSESATNNAELITTYLKDHPDASIYVPSGRWLLTGPIDFGVRNVFCDGLFYVNKDYASNYILKFGKDVGLNPSSNELINGYNLTIKLDMNYVLKTTGVEIGGFFASKIYVNVVNILGVGINYYSRMIENEIYMMVYGPYTTLNRERSGIGVQMLNNTCNDNQCVLLGRNLKLGLDLDSGLCYFYYNHLWGCITGVNARSGYYGTYFYGDYNNVCLMNNKDVMISQVVALLTTTGDDVPQYLFGNNKLTYPIDVDFLDISNLEAKGYSAHSHFMPPFNNSDPDFTSKYMTAQARCNVKHYNYTVTISDTYSYTSIDDYLKHNGNVYLNMFPNLVIRVSKSANADFIKMMRNFGYNPFIDSETATVRNFFSIDLFCKGILSSTGYNRLYSIVWNDKIYAVIKDTEVTKQSIIYYQNTLPLVTNTVSD